MFKIINKNLLNFTALLAASALVFAYGAEYFFGYQPCILCLYQRIPFFIIIAIAIFALFLKNKKLQNLVLYASMALLFINSALAFYQVGVEKKFFQGPDKCSSNNLENIVDLEELKRAIMATKAVRCDEPQFFFLSLSMASWNFLYCAAILVFLAWRIFFIKNSDKNN